jgi:four helix bundle protein
MPTYTSFEQLECWQLCREVTRWVRFLVKALPGSEKYDLESNLVRASRSATRNIAEGFGRYYYKDRIKFARVARGSLYEVLDDLITCNEDGYLDDSGLMEGRQMIGEAIRSLNGYIRYLESRNNG